MSKIIPHLLDFDESDNDNASDDEHDDDNG